VCIENASAYTVIIVVVVVVVVVVDCVRKKDQNVICNVFYKTGPILMKFVTPFPE